MPRFGPLPGWDPFRSRERLTALWSGAAVPTVTTGAAIAYRTLFQTLRRLVVGRDLTVRTNGSDLTLTVTEFDFRLEVRGLVMGQLGDVLLVAQDVTWREYRFDQAMAVLNNVHFRPRATSEVVAAPVELSLMLPADVLEELVALASPQFSAEIGDDAVVRLIESANNLAELAPIIEIGLHHEQQHQELLLTDILHAFSLNETHPSYDPQWQWPQPAHQSAADGRRGMALSGIHTIGHGGNGFCFDNEQPVHQILLQPVRVAASLVTNGEWLEFMADGGYATPTLWLSDGWTTAQAQDWQAPGYWRKIDNAWYAMTLGGVRPIDPSSPVCHVSYYEADAFARWAGKHLPTEAEWEVAAQNDFLADAFGIVWQWTRSAYSPYPGYTAAPSGLGEYNGKFMINQMVLRGSSLATPAGHSRVTYRNFFYPSARWQFSGLRLAEYRD